MNWFDGGNVTCTSHVLLRSTSATTSSVLGPTATGLMGATRKILFHALDQDVW